MKKKYFDHCLDSIFWWLMWLVPLIGGILCICTSGTHDYAAFINFLDNFSFDFVADILVDMFGVASLQLPDFLVFFLSYVVSVELCHLLTDVLIFIPRFAHKLVQLDTYVDIDDCHVGGHKK